MASLDVLAKGDDRLAVPGSGETPRPAEAAGDGERHLQEAAAQDEEEQGDDGEDDEDGNEQAACEEHLVLRVQRRFGELVASLVRRAPLGVRHAELVIEAPRLAALYPCLVAGEEPLRGEL